MSTGPLRLLAGAIVVLFCLGYLESLAPWLLKYGFRLMGLPDDLDAKLMGDKAEIARECVYVILESWKP